MFRPGICNALSQSENMTISRESKGDYGESSSSGVPSEPGG